MQHSMRAFIKETHIDFMSTGRLALTASLAVMAICLGSLLVQGLKLGLDFTGGTLIEVSYPRPVELAGVRAALGGAGFGDAQVQHFGTSSEIMIRIAPREGVNSADISTRVLQVLKEAAGGTGAEIHRVEFVGPQVGEELIENGGLAMLFALIGILIYIALRFEWRMGLGAIFATVHDTVFTIGVFSLFQIEFDLTVLAAILTVIGYSVNDTVVVLDRIRENFRKMRKESTVAIMNAAINQTLSRTIMTGMTTFMAVLTLLFFGGPTTRGFSIAMIFGLIVGTYSSIYIASAGALELGLSREDLLPRARTEVDDRP